MSTFLRSKITARTLLSTTRSPINPHYTPHIRHFSRTPFIMAKAGDSIPTIELTEGNPGEKVNIGNELASGSGLIIGVPAAFSPGCSDHHIPGYLASEKAKSIDKVFVVSVNDAFVMGAWGKKLDPEGNGKNFRYLADAQAEFTKAMGLDFDASGMLGNVRSKRFAMLTQDGKIKSVHVEPDSIGIKESAVDNVL